MTDAYHVIGAVLKNRFGEVIKRYYNCTLVSPEFIMCMQYGQIVRIDAYDGCYFEKTK